MVVTDIGSNGQVGLKGVGGIKSSAEADFDNGDITALVGKVLKTEKRQQFEKSDFFFTRSS